jgi:hypothetical protein
MGLAKYPKISDYWSRYFVDQNIFVPAIMSQNKFQEILVDNALATDDRLTKI